MASGDIEGVILQYIRGINEQNADLSLDAFAEKAEIWIAGQLMDKAGIAEMLSMVFTMFGEAPKLDVFNVFHTGSNVAVEMRVNAVTKAGKPYTNQYALIVTIEDGKIVKMNEYLDTAVVTAALS